MNDLERELDEARYILTESTGILCSYGSLGGERKVVWKVIVNGRQTGLWTRQYQARRDLREQLRERKAW
jgi:hypothetical protein